jgi:hypothetical protein
LREIFYENPKIFIGFYCIKVVPVVPFGKSRELNKYDNQHKKIACLKLFFTKVLKSNGDAPHCNANPIYVFLFWELRGLSPNFHKYVSVSDLLYKFPGSVHNPHIWLQQNNQTDPGNI